MSGALGGVSGATLVLAQAGTFAGGMSAGRGFIVIARSSFLGDGARWASRWPHSCSAYQVFLALPYVLTLLALLALAGGTRGAWPDVEPWAARAAHAGPRFAQQPA